MSIRLLKVDRAIIPQTYYIKMGKQKLCPVSAKIQKIQYQAILYFKLYAHLLHIVITPQIRHAHTVCTCYCFRLMETANRDDALRCLAKAQTALREGRVEDAERLVSKSLRMCPTEQAKGKPCSTEKPFVYIV